MNYRWKCLFTDFFLLKPSLPKVKWAEFGQPKPAEMRPVESLIKTNQTMKSNKITGILNNISIFSI